MKKIKLPIGVILRTFLIALFFAMSGTVQLSHAQYSSDSDIQSLKQSKSDAEERKKLEFPIGKTYWIVPNIGNAKEEDFRIAFGENYKLTQDIRTHTLQVKLENEFYPDQTKKFEILEIINLNFPENPDQMNNATYNSAYKIRFDDGKEGYIRSILFHIRSTNYAKWNKEFKKVDLIYKMLPKVTVATTAKKKTGVSIGMSEKEVLDSSWGRPTSVNRTINGSGKSEQWVYGTRNYLYFVNGILTTIQN